MMQIGKENAYPWKSTEDKDGEYSYLIMDCGGKWYSVDPNPMRRDGCICPNCGRIIRVVHDNIAVV